MLGSSPPTSLWHQLLERNWQRTRRHPMAENRLAGRRTLRRTGVSPEPDPVLHGAPALGAPHRRSSRSRLAVGALMLATAALLLGACGGGGTSSTASTVRAKPTKSTTTSPATSTTTSTSTDPAGASVLAVYRAGWAAYEHALADANPEDPALAATMVDPLLQRVRANLLGYQHDGIVGRGAVELYPKVASVSSVTATVLDCTFSSSELVYANTGKPVPPVTPPEHDGVRATLTLTGGTWKVSQQAVTEGKCPAGS